MVDELGAVVAVDNGDRVGDLFDERVEHDPDVDVGIVTDRGGEHLVGAHVGEVHAPAGRSGRGRSESRCRPRRIRVWLRSRRWRCAARSSSAADGRAGWSSSRGSCCLAGVRYPDIAASSAWTLRGADTGHRFRVSVFLRFPSRRVSRSSPLQGTVCKYHPKRPKPSAAPAVRRRSVHGPVSLADRSSSWWSPPGLEVVSAG